MKTVVVVELEPEEAEILVQALNSVPVRGAQAMQKILALMLKIQGAVKERRLMPEEKAPELPA